MFALHCLVCLSPFLPHVSPSASSAKLWVSSTLSSSRACSAALLAARQIRRRPRAVRMCGPPSTRIHHAFFHHVVCLFDTSLSTYVVISSFPSYPLLGLNFSFFFPSLLMSSRFVSLALPEPLLLSLALPEFSLLLAPPALSSAPLAPPALSSAPHAPPVLSSLPLLSFPVRCLFSALNPMVSHSPAPLALLLLSLALSSLPPLSLYLLIVLAHLPPSTRRPRNLPVTSLGFLSFLLLRFLPSLLLGCSLPLCFSSAHAHLTIGLVSLSCRPLSNFRISSSSSSRCCSPSAICPSPGSDMAWGCEPLVPHGWRHSDSFLLFLPRLLLFSFVANSSSFVFMLTLSSVTFSFAFPAGLVRPTPLISPRTKPALPLPVRTSVVLPVTSGSPAFSARVSSNCSSSPKRTCFPCLLCSCSVFCPCSACSHRRRCSCCSSLPFLLASAAHLIPPSNTFI